MWLDQCHWQNRGMFLSAHRSPLTLARRLGTSHAWELKTNMAEKISRVRPEHKFDEGALQEYLVQNLPGFPRNHGQWTVLQYRSVSCNVTGALVFIMFCISQCFGEKKLGCTWRARLVLANHRLQIAEQKKNEGWRKHTFSPANFKLANLISMLTRALNICKDLQTCSEDDRILLYRLHRNRHVLVIYAVGNLFSWSCSVLFQERSSSPSESMSLSLYITVTNTKAVAPLHEER